MDLGHQTSLDTPKGEHVPEEIYSLCLLESSSLFSLSRPAYRIWDLTVIIRFPRPYT